jgi:hypothetical protein
MAEKSDYSAPIADAGFSAYYEKQRANKIAQRQNSTSERRRKLSDSEESDIASKSLQWYKNLSDRDKRRYQFDAEMGATATQAEKDGFEFMLSQKYDLSGRATKTPSAYEHNKEYSKKVGQSGDVMISNTDGKRVVNPRYNQDIIENYGKNYPTTGNNAKPVPEPSSNNGEVQVAGVANAEGKVGGSQPAGSQKPVGSSPEINKPKENRDKQGFGYTDSESYSAFKKTRPTAVQDYDTQFNKGPMGERLKDIQTAQDGLALNGRYNPDVSAERKMGDAEARNLYQDEREQIKMEYDKGVQASARRDEDNRRLASGRTLGFDRERERTEKGYVADRTAFADIDKRMGEAPQIVTGRENKDGMIKTSIKNEDGSTGSMATTTQATDDRIASMRADRTKELVSKGMDEKSASKQSAQDIRQIYMAGNIDDYNTTNGRSPTKKADYTALDDKDRISALARNNYDSSKLDSDKQWQSTLAGRKSAEASQNERGVMEDKQLEAKQVASAKPLEVPFKSGSQVTTAQPSQSVSPVKPEGYNGPDASGGSADASDLSKKKKKNPNEGPMVA